jgi:hypothetical protein
MSSFFEEKLMLRFVFQERKGNFSLNKSCSRTVNYTDGPFPPCYGGVQRDDAGGLQILQLHANLFLLVLFYDIRDFYIQQASNYYIRIVHFITP